MMGIASRADDLARAASPPCAISAPADSIMARLTPRQRRGIADAGRRIVASARRSSIIGGHGDVRGCQAGSHPQCWREHHLHRRGRMRAVRELARAGAA
jgi:hypothetical protein